MTQNLQGRISREAARQMWELVARKLDLTAQEGALWMSVLDSLVFADELADHVEEGH